MLMLTTFTCGAVSALSRGLEEERDKISSWLALVLAERSPNSSSVWSLFQTSGCEAQPDSLHGGDGGQEGLGWGETTG
jgi:hypothetical protein